MAKERKLTELKRLPHWARKLVKQMGRPFRFDRATCRLTFPGELPSGVRDLSIEPAGDNYVLTAEL
jgi:hypothetical protein